MTGTAYHHGNLRAALVDAATEAARAKGSEGLALRELARRVGVSHNAAYRHFADRQSLVEEVAMRGLAGLMDAMERRLADVDEPDPLRRARRRLMEIGRGYVDFALHEPGLFQVTFTAYPELPDSPSDGADGADGADAAPDPFAVLNRALDDLVEVGFLAPDARPGAELGCWAVVHGFAVLCTEGPLRQVPAEVRDPALDAALLTIDRGYGAITGHLDPLA